MKPIIDDIGSFPLPSHVNRGDFEQAYRLARELIIMGKDLREDLFIFNNFYRVVLDSFMIKLNSGLDVATYPQHYDMHKQFIEVIHKAMERGTYVVEEEHAIIPEVYVIAAEANRLYDEFGHFIALRVCVTGPLELYLAEVGAKVYEDILFMFAETVRRFIKNAILNSKHIKTVVISLDEPSFGIRDIVADRDLIVGALERALDVKGVIRQIHIHAPTRITDLLEARNLDVISIEAAASPRNIEYISRDMLEKADKNIRVGVSRTDINNIMAELYNRGVVKPQIEQLVEDEEVIMKRFLKAKMRFGERLTFTGPDCGLGGWPSQEVAELLLKRTVRAVRKALDHEDVI
ncbi:MAG: hypothetical protein QXR17_04780 [Candidatus Bathyarchaeia archaeon]